MFKVVPADLARKGDCSAATRAVEAMRDGRERDFEAERVGEICEKTPFDEKVTFDGRPIREIQKDLRAAKREYRMIVRCAGDDMGCDGTAESAAAARGWVRSYESELEEARSERKKKPSGFGKKSFGVAPRSCRVSKRALAKGTKIERREHGVPVKFARKIARDHLCENSKYYAKSR